LPVVQVRSDSEGLEAVLKNCGLQAQLHASFKIADGSLQDAAAAAQ